MNLSGIAFKLCADALRQRKKFLNRFGFCTSLGKCNKNGRIQQKRDYFCNIQNEYINIILDIHD